MKKVIRLSESDLNRIVRRVIKENMDIISMFSPSELENIFNTVGRLSQPGFFEDYEASTYLMYDVAKGDQNIYNSLVNWLSENGLDTSNL